MAKHHNKQLGKNYGKQKSLRSMVQTIGIIAAIMSMVGGVTYAALQSQQLLLKSNSITTPVANLSMSIDNTNFGTTLNGFPFTGLIPGGSAVPSSGWPVYLRNDGTTPLAISISADPTLVNPNNVDLKKVHLILQPAGGGVPQNFLLSDLITANATNGLPLTSQSLARLVNNSTTSFTLQIMMDSDAFSGGSAIITGLILVFNATAVS